MTASSTALLEGLAQLVSQFNRGTLDLPDGLLDRGAPLRLNGVAYEDTMGRPVGDPLVRLVARGPAAYRFLAQALRYALPDAEITLGALERQPAEGGFLVHGPARLTGTLRAPHQSFAHEASLRLRFNDDGRLVDVDVTMAPEAVAALRAARAT
jgi:hypothetical protein